MEKNLEIFSESLLPISGITISLMAYPDPSLAFLLTLILGAFWGILCQIIISENQDRILLFALPCLIIFTIAKEGLGEGVNLGILLWLTLATSFLMSELITKTLLQLLLRYEI